VDLLEDPEHTVRQLAAASVETFFNAWDGHAPLFQCVLYVQSAVL